MRFTFFLFLLCSTYVFGQAPANDECVNAIDISVVADCENVIYSNINATASDIGANNAPACFIGGVTDRDVWFVFTSTDALTNIIIDVEGSLSGSNTRSIIDPQIALYKGSCGELEEVACAFEQSGLSAVRLAASNLTPDIEYFIRINNVGADSESKDGDFSVCIQPQESIFLMGASTSSSDCSGRLFDSGGAAGNYKNNEDNVFTVCPTQTHSCINIEVSSFQIIDADVLNIYGGDNTSAPLIASLNGVKSNSDFDVFATSECVTFEFISNNVATSTGFELAWSCAENDCEGVSFTNPRSIASIPFDASASTCDGGATFATSPCSTPTFINGPEMIYSYESAGGGCIGIEINNAAAGTGVLVLDGLPGDPDTRCVAFNATGKINSADTRIPGTYYIVVANAAGCTDFDISIEEQDCNLSPALADALCNPINSCITSQQDTLTVFLENGFKDLDISPGSNGGCWIDDGEQPDYFWFTVQAASSGDLGFKVFAAGAPSDLDFNVWGPFSEDMVCGQPEEVIATIETTQPIRSSWFHEAEVTGLARVNPFTGDPVDDVYDCGGTPSGLGDGFVLPIVANEGEIYVVLINDWDNLVGDAGINLVWETSSPGVTNPIPTEVLKGDTAVCAGASAEIELQNFSNEVRWIGETSTLSCTDCPNPIATPNQTTVYTAIVDKACTSDTVSVRVAVIELSLESDEARVCVGETFQIVAGEDYSNATYSWSFPNTASGFVELSCTDCPNPEVTTLGTLLNAQTTVDLTVELDGGDCSFTDVFTLIIEPQQAPEFEIRDDFNVCESEGAFLATGSNPGNLTYTWSSDPIGFVSSERNPAVILDQTTTFFVSVENGSCPVPSVDSVTATVIRNPIIDVITDTTICQGDVVIGGNTVFEEGVIYNWTGPSEIINPNDPNAALRPDQSGTFTFRAVRDLEANCSTSGTFDIDVIPNNIEIDQGDTMRVCKGEQAILSSTTNPSDVVPTWSSNAGDQTFSFDSVPIMPDRITTFYVEIENMGCSSIDSILVVLDSLPNDLSILPQDTVVCEGSPVILESPIFEPKEFMDITFLWAPNDIGNFQTGDSLYNMVITPDTTVNYLRVTTNGACVDTALTTVFVDTPPDVMIVPSDTTICPGDPVQLQVIVDPEVELEEIMWSPAESLSCMDCLDPIASPVGGTTYSMSAQVGACSVEASASVSILNSLDLGLSEMVTICAGEVLTLTAILYNDVEYTWTSTDPNFGTQTNNSITISPSENTTYSLVARYQSANCPEANATVNVTVVQPGVVTAAASETAICPGEGVTLSATLVSGGTNNDIYTWVDNQGREFVGQEVTVNPSVTTTYRLVYVSANGCSSDNSQTVTIFVEPPVLINLSTSADNRNRTIAVGSEVEIMAELITNGLDVSISWMANDETLSTTEETFVDVPTANTVYKITVNAPNGCVYMEEVLINVVEPRVVIPNAFTPNGDGQNDFFNIVVDGEVILTEFKVYSRWGQLVYDNENPENGWDGNYNGSEAPSDTYAYIISYQFIGGGRTVTEKGDVTLIR